MTRDLTTIHRPALRAKAIHSRRGQPAKGPDVLDRVVRATHESQILGKDRVPRRQPHGVKARDEVEEQILLPPKQQTADARLAQPDIGRPPEQPVALS
ncbi:hypothetical protein D3C72_2004210 [compost metagenome]